MKYIAERPRSHGLFSSGETTDMEKAVKEVSSHPAPVWTFIYSLKREDAVRLGYDSAASWRQLIMAHQTELAEAMKIQYDWKMAEIYGELKSALYDDSASWAEQAEAVQSLEQLWGSGFTAAAYQLGKCWRDGLGVLPDDEKAELWFHRAAESGHDFAQYALGKLMQSEKRMEEAVSWYEKAAARGNQYANYRLGKLYLQGEGVPKAVDRASDYLTRSAESGNQYAQYTLGKLYLPQDRKTAWYWFSESAAQGNEYAQLFLDRWDNLKAPSVMLSVTRLLHRMGEIFRDNSVAPQAPVGQQTDRKLRLRIREKKIALGHRADDHEEYNGPSMSM